jgi:hypothetical protein
MMKFIIKLAVVTIAILLIGCRQEFEVGDVRMSMDTDITCDNEKRASFVLECIKNGNPMSDEEPEDLVAECQNVSYSMFCSEEKRIVNSVCIKAGSKYSALFEEIETLVDTADHHDSL